MTIWLRIIQINDVYELDSFPQLKTLIDQYRSEEGPDTTLVICAGDFLAPSLLSSLDRGAAMIDVFNHIGITYVCLGNHETDVPLNALVQRIQQSQFTWINTNMPELQDKLPGIHTPDYALVTVRSSTPTSTSTLTPSSERVVALLGLLTEDPALYRPGAFANAKIHPIMESAQQYLEKLRQIHYEQEGDEKKKKIDLIIPMTHQSITDDRRFAQHFTGQKFPLVLGGHDHEPFDEIHQGSRIIKTGMNAKQAAVIDIKWPDDHQDLGTEESSTPPEIQVQMLSTSDFAPDPEISQRVQSHQTILRELETSRLFSFEDWLSQAYANYPGPSPGEKVTFSTCNNRLGPSTGSTILCSMVRMGMRCHGALMNAGSIRGNKDYGDCQFFTWSDLKNEIPFPTGMTACYIPGRVLEATIAYSRRGCRENPPVAHGGYLHTCSNIEYSDGEERIITVGGQAFDPDKEYLVALPAQLFGGIDNQKPLLDWAAEHKPDVHEEAAVPAKLVLVEVFSSLLWLRLGSFDDIDKDHDGYVTRDDLKRRLAEVYGMECVADLVVDSAFSVADSQQDGKITPLEMMIVQFSATDLISHVVTAEEMRIMKEVAANVLGKDPSHFDVLRFVENLHKTLDVVGDGKIHRDEFMQALGVVSKKDLLE